MFVCFTGMITFTDNSGIAAVESYLRLFGPTLRSLFADRDFVIDFRALPDADNEYRDVAVRLNKTIYISVSEAGALGLTDPELFAAVSHEIGHIVYGMLPFGQDAESRADSLAAELGLGTQMISLIDKIIASRRFRNLTTQLVRRIQYLQHLA